MTEHREFVHIYRQFPAGYQAINSLEDACRDAMDHTIFELVKLRASQINGCAYCIDMHHKDARAAGETEERLYMLPAWREATVYTEPERAALAMTEAMTLISQGAPSREVEGEARRVFEPEAYAALVFTIATINAWNRLAITSHSEPGRYQPKSRAE